MFIERLAYDGRTFVMATPEQLAEAGVPQALIDPAITPVIIAAAHAEIQALAARAFTASTAQGVIYDAKYAEAKAYVAAGSPSNTADGAYPFLQAEAPARGLSKPALAARIIATGDAWRHLAARMEAARALITADVSAAVGIEAKRAAAEARIAPIAEAVAAL